jgi:hypothetical protein
MVLKREMVAQIFESFCVIGTGDLCKNMRNCNIQITLSTAYNLSLNHDKKRNVLIIRLLSIVFCTSHNVMTSYDTIQDDIT